MYSWIYCRKIIFFNGNIDVYIFYNANIGPDAYIEIEYNTQVWELPSHALATRTKLFWLLGIMNQCTPWGNLLNYIWEPERENAFPKSEQFISMVQSDYS